MEHTTAYHVLLFIERNGSATSHEAQGHIASLPKKNGYSLSYASNVLRRLYSWGKVKRVPHHVTNNRGFKYVLTERGKDTCTWLHEQGAE